MAKKVDELRDVDGKAARASPEDIGTRASERLGFFRGLDLAGKRVLDVGCGQGPDLLAMSKLGAGELFGLDMAPNAVKLAGRVLEGKSAYLVVADALALPFRSGYFDVVNVSHMLHHHPWPLVKTIISEIARVLKPGGMLVVREPCPPDERAALVAELVEVLHDLGALLKVAGEKPGLPEELRHYLYLRSWLFGFGHFYPTAFRDLLAQMGFKVEEMAVVGHHVDVSRLVRTMEERARQLPFDGAEREYVEARIRDLKDKLASLGYKGDCRLLLVAKK